VEGALREGGREPGLKLIETMLWDGGSIPRLSLHLSRLMHGAEALNWRVPVETVAAALAGVRPATPARLRLTLDRAGHVAVEAGPLPEAPAAPWRIALAPLRLRSDDPWLGVKSTHRAAYDAVRAALPEGIDEAVFLNERGEVCDGTITTVFFDRGQGMRTPPLSAGVLPGVLRAEMAVPEEVLAAADLPRVSLWVGNALRGLIPARWTGTELRA
jgi:4-amino-4-deoxychorismate lyase